MPYVKISELPAGTTPLAGTELLEIVQGGVSKKVSIDDMPAAAAVGSIAAKDFWSGTQTAYDALGTYDANTIYFITGA